MWPPNLYDTGMRDNENLWIATKFSWRLEVRWDGLCGKYVCRAVQGAENPYEARTLDYPHEVIEWLGEWFTRLADAKP